MIIFKLWSCDRRKRCIIGVNETEPGIKNQVLINGKKIRNKTYRENLENHLFYFLTFENINH